MSEDHARVHELENREHDRQCRERYARLDARLAELEGATVLLRQDLAAHAAEEIEIVEIEESPGASVEVAESEAEGAGAESEAADAGA